MIYGSLYDSDYSPQNYKTGYIIMVLLVIAVILLLWFFGWTISGLSNDPGSLQFQGVNSQYGLSGGSSGFINSRHAPYFSDVTNDVLRREDTEAEAVRALAKINQERVRRAPPSDSAPLEWGPFWDEWKQTHGSTDYTGDMLEGYTDTDLLKTRI